MEDLAPYTYLLIFAVLALLNYVMQRIARWLRQQQTTEGENTKPSQEKKEDQAQELKRPTEHLPRRGAEVRPRSEGSAPDSRRGSAPGRRTQPKQDEPWEVREARTRLLRTKAPTIPSIPEAGPQGIRPLLRGRRNLRQAVVMMTVLGPCRAQQPVDPD